MLSKFSIAVNVLPFYGYRCHWKWLMLCLCKTTRKMYLKSKNVWQRLDEWCPKDIKRMFQLMSQYPD